MHFLWYCLKPVTKSIHKKYSQSQLTKIFAQQAGLETFGDLHRRIWFNIADNHSLRLTMEGYRFVTEKLKLQSYEFELEKPLSNKNLLQLERYFQSIYYLIQKKIVVFDEQEAMMLTLHSSDLPNYLRDLEKGYID